VRVPETRFVQSGQSYVGYQVLGEGTVDLVYAGTAFTNMDAQWGVPSLVEFLERLASFSRLILFDKRGVGVSDPVFGASMPTVEDWGDDLNAVLDGVGSQRAVLFGSQGGGHGCMLFAATHPERVDGLILHDCYAFGGGLPFGQIGGGDFETWIAYAMEHWPKADGIWAPPDPNLRSVYAQYHRACVSPGVLGILLRVAASVDLRHILGSIRCPTLVLDTNGHLLEGEGKYLTERIVGASRISLPPGSPVDSPAIVDAVGEFVTGARLPVEADSILATILFTDIVDSTGTAARLGDRAWTDLLERYRSTVRSELHRYRGREINTRGDDFLAVFDGPARAIRCAQAIRRRVEALGLEVRSGLHTGEIQLIGDDVGGIAVHIGARVSEYAGPGEVVVSSAIPPLLAGSDLHFIDRGAHEMRGVPGAWRLYSVQSDEFSGD
jgi:class 3 adenylate cyclase/pimeloyl-ACP methyl ester carboxylesterase